MKDKDLILHRILATIAMLEKVRIRLRYMHDDLALSASCLYTAEEIKEFIQSEADDVSHWFDELTKTLEKG